MRRWLWGPAGLAVAVRLAVWLAGGLWALGGSELTLDTVEYHALAVSLAEGNGFVYDAPYAPPYEVEALRTPGYPAFVAAVYAVLGARPGWVLLLQILLDGAACLLIAHTFRQPLGERGAGLAALAFALHPAASLFSVILLSESLFVFLLVAAFALLWGPWTGRTSLRAAAAGALLGGAVLVKPLAMWAVPVVALASTHRKHTRPLRQPVLLLGLAVLVVAPWIARNDAVWARPMLSTSGAYNALVLYAAPVHADATGTDTRDAIRQLTYQADIRARDAGVRTREIRDVDRAPFWREVAVETLAAHPLSAVKLEATGVVRQFVSIGRVSRQHVFSQREAQPRDPGLAGALRWWWGGPGSDKILDLWALLYALAVYPLLAVGTVRAMRERRGGALLAAGALALFFLLATGIPGYSRFMIPAVPFWAAFVGLAASRRGAPPARADARVTTARPAVR